MFRNYNFTKNKPKKVETIVWRQELNLFGHNVLLETNNTKKNIGERIFKTFKKFKTFKLNFISARTPFLLKICIGIEITSFLYFYLLQDKINLQFIKDNNKFLNFWEKETIPDYISNMLIYYFIGKTLWLSNNKKFYSVFLIGSGLSYLLYNSNEKLKIKLNEKYNISNFNYFSPSPNLVPKILLSTSFVKFLNYFLLEKVYSNGLNRKCFIMFLFLFFISKFSQFFALYTSDTFNLGNIDGVISTITGTLLNRPTFLPGFIFIFYFNPYSGAVWVNAKNHIDDEELKKIYKSKSYFNRLKAYLTYTTLIAGSNMLNIYF